MYKFYIKIIISAIYWLPMFRTMLGNYGLETSLIIQCNPRNDIRIVWFLFVPDVCANHTCVNGDCLATSSKTWECRCYNGWKGQNCDIGMFISKKHVVIETEIFIKTQILHLKIRLIRSRKQRYFTNRCFFLKRI